ncbi:MAG TPA: hypothetical protein VF079_06215 [Sphingomicrobium sp.]
MAAEPHVAQMRRQIRGYATMLSLRLRTGLSGLFAVTGVLLAMQLATGIQAFPL